MSQSDAKLLRQFVDAFSEFDDMIALGNRPGDLDLAAGEVDELGFQHWQPRETSSDPAALESLYSLLPFRYPALFEQLLLTWRWAPVDLQFMELLANPPCLNLSGFVVEVLRDAALSSTLLGAGFLQFGRAGGGRYDPVCFDTRRRLKDGDCPVVCLDHEDALCDQRIRLIAELQPSFRTLLESVVEHTDHDGRERAV